MHQYIVYVLTAVVFSLFVHENCKVYAYRIVAKTVLWLDPMWLLYALWLSLPKLLYSQIWRYLMNKKKYNTFLKCILFRPNYNPPNFLIILYQTWIILFVQVRKYVSSCRPSEKLLTEFGSTEVNVKIVAKLS